MSRETNYDLYFPAVSYYDGQGFMVKKDLGVSSAKELDGATICIQTGTTTEASIALLPKVGEYLSLMMTLVLAFGVAFQQRRIHPRASYGRRFVLK